MNNFTATNVWLDVPNKHLYFTTDYIPRSPNDVYIANNDRTTVWGSVDGFTNLATAPDYKYLMALSPPYAAMPGSGTYYLWFSENDMGQQWAQSQALSFPIPAAIPISIDNESSYAQGVQIR